MSSHSFCWFEVCEKNHNVSLFENYHSSLFITWKIKYIMFRKILTYLFNKNSRIWSCRLKNPILDVSDSLLPGFIYFLLANNPDYRFYRTRSNIDTTRGWLNILCHLSHRIYVIWREDVVITLPIRYGYCPALERHGRALSVCLANSVAVEIAANITRVALTCMIRRRPALLSLHHDANILDIIT